MNINDSHFGPDSVGKMNVSYQNAKRKKSKRSMKGKFFLCYNSIYEFNYSLISIMLRFECMCYFLYDSMFI
jgi:hypothetical protein